MPVASSLEATGTVPVSYTHLSRRERVVRPAEMVSVSLSSGQITASAGEELVVRLVREGDQA